MIFLLTCRFITFIINTGQAVTVATLSDCPTSIYHIIIFFPHLFLCPFAEISSTDANDNDTFLWSEQTQAIKGLNLPNLVLVKLLGSHSGCFISLLTTLILNLWTRQMMCYQYSELSHTVLNNNVYFFKNKLEWPKSFPFFKLQT